MKRLRRPPAPEGLSRYAGGHDRWEDFHNTACKADVKRTLAEMQHDLCAYCEGEVGAGAHIEHLARRQDYPQRTFDWDNLFLSCGRTTTCGHYKDRPGATPYAPSQIIDPTREDPHEHLLFRESGTVNARSDRTQRRAEVTIEVLNLNEGSLRARRARQLKFFQQREPDLMDALQSFSSSDRRAYIESELAMLEFLPCTASARAFLRAALPE